MNKKIVMLLLCGASCALAGSIDRYNVVWESPSQDPTGQMPLGKGDILLTLDPTLSGETHTLTVTDRVEITGSNYRNTAMATVSLLQAIQAKGYHIINVSWKPNYLTPGWRWDPEYIYHRNMFRWENHWKAAPSHVPIQFDPYPNDRIMGGMMCSWESPDEMEIPGIRLRLAPLSERIWWRCVPLSQGVRARLHPYATDKLSTAPSENQSLKLCLGALGKGLNRRSL